MIARSDAFLAAALGVSALAGCTSDPVAARCDGGDTCERPCGPYQVCLRLAECTYACVLPDNQFGITNETALREGFGASPLRLYQVPDRVPAAFRWEPFEGARVVHCALFVQWPRMAVGADGRVVIANYDEAVRGHQTFEPPEGTFDLSLQRIPDGELEFSAYGPFVACWAYSAGRLIAASNILRVAPEALPVPWLASVRVGCEQRGDGRRDLCDPGTGQLGVCVALDGRPTCVHRCTAPVQCDIYARQATLARRTDAGADAGALGGGDGGAPDPVEHVCSHDVWPINYAPPDDGAPSPVGFCVTRPRAANDAGAPTDGAVDGDAL
ncbi:MAG: hypothetical protein U0324_24575 [Polyangiales bacterium]